ncbi:MAG: hypothetical protein IH872_02205 [Chloroflexi bacterium]|nr:hypothetical protein [Chloroflexota bacterium]
MLRNSARQTGHQVAKKNRNTGWPRLDSWAVDRFVPSINVNSKCGRVLPTPVPTSGCSTITATLGGGSVGTGVGSGVGLGCGVDVGIVVVSGRGVDAGIAAESDGGVNAGATVGSGDGLEAGTGVDDETAAKLLSVPALDADASVGDWMGGGACGTTSAAVVPQANTPITTAIKGKASSRGIFWLFPTVQADGPKLCFGTVIICPCE